mgnify:CR=1 FL=1
MANLATNNRSNEMEAIDNRIVKRANKAFRYLPFNFNFYADAQAKGLNAETVFIRKHDYQVTGGKWFKHSSSIEAAFRWLITIGILRREVDGQGLTSRVRLTPLGRKILEQTPELPDQQAGLIEHINICLHRSWLLR